MFTKGGIKRSAATVSFPTSVRIITCAISVTFVELKGNEELLIRTISQSAIVRLTVVLWHSTDALKPLGEYGLGLEGNQMKTELPTK